MTTTRYSTNYTPLVIIYWKFATDKPLSLQTQSLSVTDFLDPQTQAIYLAAVVYITCVYCIYVYIATG